MKGTGKDLFARDDPDGLTIWAWCYG